MADCSSWNLLCKGASESAEKIQESIINSWAETMLDGLDKTMASLGTFWVKVPTPDVSETSTTMEWVGSVTEWLVIVLAAFSLIFAFSCLIWHQRGETVRSIIKGLLTLILVSATSLMFGQTVIDMSDATATWFLDQAAPDSTNFSTKILTIVDLDKGQYSLAIIILLGLLGVIANLVQIALMFTRSVMLILLLAAVPLAAAMSMTDFGATWLRKLVGWFFAFAVFKPTAALIYAIAIKLIEGDSYNIADDGELLKFVLGVGMMVLAPFALPALVSFMVPVAGALGGGGSGAGLVAAGAGAVATGAMAVTRINGSDGVPGAYGASGGSRDAGPSGSQPTPATAGPPGPTGKAGADGGGQASGSAGAAGGSKAAASSGAASAGGASGAAAAGAATGGAATVVMGVAEGAKTVSQAAQSAADSATGSSEVAR